MSYIVSVHSYKGGVGKTNLAANLAALMAAKGMRVGMIDADLHSPGMHTLFGIRDEEIERSLNGYLNAEYPVADAAYNVTRNLGVHVEGELFLVPSSMNPGEIVRMLNDGFDFNRMTDGLDDLHDELELDMIFIDTHPGIKDDTLLTVAITDALLILLRPDQQDYQGTHVINEVVKRLNIPDVGLVINKMPRSLDVRLVKREIEKVYQLPIRQIFPHSDELMTLASSGVFSLLHPNHPISAQYRELASFVHEQMKAHAATL
ncbi:MAG: MinD/ParA family protein [Chloroflexota bacterium]